MKQYRYLFVGNRFYVLQQMLELGLNLVSVIATKGSYLEKELVARNIPHITVARKQELLQILEDTVFDVLVSNGCPYILPVSKLRKGEELFINIHPSLLPDLKGLNPVNGAVLFNRRHGVTCHMMDDGIDTGESIAQIEIPQAATLPLELLYQLTFRAEGEAFLAAYKREFKVDKLLNQRRQAEVVEPLYYTRKPEDLFLKANDPMEVNMRRVRAFQLEGQYARFIRKDREYVVYHCDLIKNDYLCKYDAPIGHIAMLFLQYVLTKEEGCYCLWHLDHTDGLREGEPLLL